jgi:hypothetical protein
MYAATVGERRRAQGRVRIDRCVFSISLHPPADWSSPATVDMSTEAGNSTMPPCVSLVCRSCSHRCARNGCRAVSQPWWQAVTFVEDSG